MQKGISLRVVPPNTSVLATLRVQVDHLTLVGNGNWIASQGFEEHKDACAAGLRHSFTGVRIGAPFSLTRTTMNFAGFVSLAFLPTR
jgi:hypothetical protein